MARITGQSREFLNLSPGSGRAIKENHGWREGPPLTGPWKRFALRSERRSYSFDETFRCERFLQQNRVRMVCGHEACLDITGHEAHDRFGSMLCQPFGENEPIELRHDDISQQQMNRPLVRGCKIQRFSTVAGFDNLIPMTGKDAPNEAADRFVVIDQQYGDGISDAGHVAVVLKLRPQTQRSGT